MKKVLLALVMVSSVSAAHSSDFNLETITAADLGVKIEAVEVPAPAPVRDAAQDLAYKFQQVTSELRSVRNDLTWVRSDIDNLESRVRRAIQMNAADPFMQSELSRMNMDLSRHYSNLQRAANDVRGLLNQGQKSADLNRAARDMDWAASDLLSAAWPTLDNSAQRLEWTVRAGKPEIVGFNAQWAAMDISRNCRQLSDQARNASFDTRNLVSQTQP